MKKLLFSLALFGWAQAVPPRVDFPPQIEIRVVHNPTVAPLAGGDWLLYELQLCNHQTDSYQIEELTFLDQSGKPIQSWGKKELAGALKHFGHPEDKSLTLAPGRSALVYCSLPAGADLQNVRHRLAVNTEGKAAVLEDSGFAPGRESLPSLATPFGRGGHWAAISAPDNDSVHRRALMTLDGQFHISQRFAIDWVLTDEQHRYFGGDGKQLADHYCYGVPALAVTDGIVVDLQDGLAEGLPGSSERPYPITPRSLGGNWVALEIAPGRYAMYAHLQPGSLQVRKGQTVRRGQPLGLIGNSGNSTAPHLHLHVSDRPDWVGAEGTPYQFPAFRCLGKVTLSEDERRLEFSPNGAGEFRGKIPAQDALVEFSEEK